jgi:hypothetical protein
VFVDEDLDRPQVRLDAPDECGGGVEVERVVDVGPRTDLRGRRLDAFRRLRADRHARAPGRELLRDAETDSLRGAHHERHLAFEPEVHAGQAYPRSAL